MNASTRTLKNASALARSSSLENPAYTLYKTTINVENKRNLKRDTHLDDVLHRKRRLETCVYLSTSRQDKNQRRTAEKQRNIDAKKISSHRIVVCLKKFTRSIDGFAVHSKTTEEGNEILVAHASLDQLECTLLQRRVHSISQTATLYGIQPILSATVLMVNNE